MIHRYVKICGINTLTSLEAAIVAGASAVGLVFYPRSPRNISVALASVLTGKVCGRVEVVALLVDPDDDLVRQVCETFRPDVLQLHGKETPERCAEIASQGRVRIMKALSIAESDDLAKIPPYLPVVERILVDAKPPPLAGALPGGNGLAFDHRLVVGLDLAKPLVLSGGLTPETVGDAIRLTGVEGVDVSSGVEQAPGVKDPEKIRAFVAESHRAFDRNSERKAGP
jgi:phosphoribosylanthranilate isomerase